MASVRKRGKYYEYRIVYRDHLGKRHKSSGGGFKTKTQAKAAAVEAEYKLKYNPMNDSNVTLLEYYMAWAKLYKKPHITKKTWASYTQTENHIKKYFGEIKLKNITPVRYQEFLNDFATKYSQDTIERTHYHIKSAVKIAVRDQVILSNFTEGAIVKSKKEKRPEAESYLEEDEYLNVIEASQKNPQYISHIVALSYTCNSSQIAFYINYLKLTLISLPTPTSQLGLLKLLPILLERSHSQLSLSQ